MTSVKRFSQDSRSLVSEDEQVGKHSGGSAGCRAVAGSGGIAGGSTRSGGKGGGLLAQLASSSASAASIGLSARETGIVGILGLLVLGDAAQGLLRVLAAFLGRLGMLRGSVPLDLGPVFGQLELCCSQPAGLHPGEAQGGGQSDQQAEDDPGAGVPAHADLPGQAFAPFSMPAARPRIRPCW